MKQNTVVILKAAYSTPEANWGDVDDEEEVTTELPNPSAMKAAVLSLY